MASYEVRAQARFEAAHHLTSYRGRPEPVHGHSFMVEVTVAADRLDEEGMAFDFIQLRRHLEELVAKLHHRDLNTVAPFDRTTPTSEHLARWFFRELSPSIDGGRARLSAVAVWEGPTCCATYREEG
jgi:6-pyruvoyltetrahydropterin/6-carboxytetrahydropterin synthase